MECSEIGMGFAPYRLVEKLSNMKRPSLILFVALVGFLAMGNSHAQAVVLDLTGLTTEGFINSALFSRTNKTGSGTGNIDAFVQIDGPAIDEKAYDTTVNGVFNNKNSNTFNHAITLSQVPFVTINGINYREFLLDIDEPGNTDSFLTIDEIQIFVSNTANQSTTSIVSGILQLSANSPAPLYRLDAGGNNTIRLDSTLAGGQGQDDMFAYIPDSAFPGSGTQFVYLFSRFGGDLSGTTGNRNQGGFEEWAVRVVANPPCQQTRTCPVIPEPGSLFLMGSGLLGAFRFRSLKRRKNS